MTKYELIKSVLTENEIKNGRYELLAKDLKKSFCIRIYNQAMAVSKRSARKMFNAEAKLNTYWR